MSIAIGDKPAALPASLLEKLERVSFPTLGHYLEEGFADAGLTRQVGTGRVVGRAITVRTTATDSNMLHHAVGYLEAGDVLVIETGGDVRHAPVGLVIAAGATIRGAHGIIVDGVITDVDEIADYGIPVYSRGRTILTTKLHDIDAGGMNVPVVCGSVHVQPGDVVLADSNGVFFASAATLEAIIDTALEDDAEEPDLVAALRDGARLGDETGATATIMSFIADANAQH